MPNINNKEVYITYITNKGLTTITPIILQDFKELREQIKAEKKLTKEEKAKAASKKKLAEHKARSQAKKAKEEKRQQKLLNKFNK